MKKVGFIDYYLNEWHADNYPKWISDNSYGEYEVQYAWAAIDCPFPGMKSNKQWAEEHKIELCATMEEVIAKSDVLIVLSPDNAEQHEKLSRLPLQSGKRVYIDKTFANDRATAKRIFDVADKYKSVCFSTSALRFASEYVTAKKDGLIALNSWGPGNYETYSIHQIEPIVVLMGTKAQRVMHIGNDKLPGLIIEFEGNRFATMFNYDKGSPFMMNLAFNDENRLIQVQSDFFQEFIKAMLNFFETGDIKASHEETLTVISIREAGFKAAENPGTWIDVAHS